MTVWCVITSDFHFLIPGKFNHVRVSYLLKKCKYSFNSTCMTGLHTRTDLGLERWWLGWNPNQFWRITLATPKSQICNMTVLMTLHRGFGRRRVRVQSSCTGIPSQWEVLCCHQSIKICLDRLDFAELFTNSHNRRKSHPPKELHELQCSLGQIWLILQCFGKTFVQQHARQFASKYSKVEMLGSRASTAQ